VEKKVKAPGWRRVWKNGHENGHENKRHLSAGREQKTFSQKNKKAARIFVRAAFAVWAMWCDAMWCGAVRCDAGAEYGLRCRRGPALTLAWAPTRARASVFRSAVVCRSAGFIAVD
jgi:hypothetical protein